MVAEGGDTGDRGGRVRAGGRRCLGGGEGGGGVTSPRGGPELRNRVLSGSMARNKADSLRIGGSDAWYTTSANLFGGEGGGEQWIPTPLAQQRRHIPLQDSHKLEEMYMCAWALLDYHRSFDA